MSRPLTIAILDRDAAIYAEGIRVAVPGVTVHAATTEAEILDACGDAQVLVGLAQSISPAMVGRAGGLRWIQALTTGIDPLLDIAGIGRAVTITNGRGVHGPQMSELAFLYMLDFARDIRAILRDQAERRWERRPQRLLAGKTVVIVGVGAIALDLAARCKAFGMRTVGVSGRDAAPGFDLMVPRERIVEAAGLADYLVAVVPLSPETRGLIDGAVLDAMPAHGVLINIARGPVVDEDALIDRLRRGSIAGAALDTFTVEPLPVSSPLWDMPNVLITPHIGGMSESYAEQILPLLIHNVRAFSEARVADMLNVVQR